MPQAWSTNYTLDGLQVEPNMAGDWFYSTDSAKMEQWVSIKEKVSRRNLMIHTIGNLTIVTQPLNSALRNAPFDAKKTELRHSSLMLNQYFDELSEWNDDSIRLRAQILSEYARRLWPYPQKSVY
jgi:membrane-associated protease RseP (regulator of RpoE activity)